MDDDDFINPNNLGAGGYGDDGNGGGNWYDDDEDDEEDKGAEEVNNDGNGGSKMRPKMKRKGSVYNKHTAHESMTVGLRVAGSYGPFCSLPHVMSLDKELQEKEKNEKIYSQRDRYLIDELKARQEP